MVRLTVSRGPNLRQIEAFKAVIEFGTVSRAAGVLNVSQPAVSKLLKHLEEETGLKLFDRRKGRLAATTQGMRLYEEIERIFGGVQQIKSAVDVIRREEQGILLVGVLPALSGAFIQRATMGFLKRHPKVYCSIQSMSSQWVADSVLTHKLDVGLVSSRIDNPFIITESLMEEPLLCIMPPGHALERHAVIRPEHLSGVPFVSFNVATYTGQKIAGIFEQFDVEANVVLTANVTPTVCQFVGAGLGVSLVHPLFLAGMEDEVVTRPFEPATMFDFLLCYARDARNATLVADFVRETKAVAARHASALAHQHATTDAA
jgi:DNA-binding transcriptional LysR family regulator